MVEVLLQMLVVQMVAIVTMNLITMEPQLKSLQRVELVVQVQTQVVMVVMVVEQELLLDQLVQLILLQLGHIL